MDRLDGKQEEKTGVRQVVRELKNQHGGNAPITDEHFKEIMIWFLISTGLSIVAAIATGYYHRLLKK